MFAVPGGGTKVVAACFSASVARGTVAHPASKTAARSKGSDFIKGFKRLDANGMHSEGARSRTTVFRRRGAPRPQRCEVKSLGGRFRRACRCARPVLDAAVLERPK